MIFPRSCVNKFKLYNQYCLFICKLGYKMVGSSLRRCNASGHWNVAKLPLCQDIQRPAFKKSCPANIYKTTDPQKSYATVSWISPEAEDNSGEVKLFSQPPGLRQPHRFPIGATKVTYTAIDSANNTKVCTFTVNVRDQEQPQITCPSSFRMSPKRPFVKVWWSRPNVTDNSGPAVRIESTREPGQKFTYGKHVVTYRATDLSNNTAICNFNVVIAKKRCKVFPKPINGEKRCDGWIYGSYCTVSCKRGYRFTNSPASLYVCGASGHWIPDDFPPPCSGSCKKALGMENEIIEDEQITSPSVLDKNHMPHYARRGHDSAWCSATRQFSYIQVDLRREHVIRAITIEGGGRDTLKWVTRYRISYRSDGTWKWYKKQGKLKTLKGVNRFNRHRKRVLKGVTADIIRVHPQRVGGVSHSSPTVEYACLKLELFGCPAAECRELLAPVHGRIHGTSFKHPAQIMFSCDVGFRLQGSSSLTCQSSGKWDLTPPACHVVDCGKLTQPSNGQITLETSTTYNGTVRFACNLGYELTGSSVRRCQPNGQWSGVNTVCQTVYCGDPGTPEHSTRELSRGFRYKDTIHFRCFPNHVIVGSALIVCQENKTWNASLPKCLAPCRNPGSPNFGKRIGDNFQHGKKVHFQCARSYEISGRTVIECREGKWSSPTPRCMAPCDDPGKPKNGNTLQIDYRHGRIIRFSCRSGFKINGNNNITCYNGKWSGQKPRCIGAD